ncbi:SDR family oxidoreductase [Haloarchaeobius sp. DFWS5]|uniref:SDR family oxidoreductase n=1 Tax=Haloarchaeobius sp. DFWS5 TaxID=3446114 RepID=UPI003EB78095
MTHDTYRILVAGVGGGTGAALLEYLKGTDYTVRAFVDQPNPNESLRRKGADEVVVGDLFDPDDVASALADVDGVLCAVDTRWTDLLWGTPAVGAGARTLVDAAARAGVSYFVLESTIGVGDSRAQLSLPRRLLYRRVLRERENTERALQESGLPFTVLRYGRLVGGERSEDVVVAEGGDAVSGRIATADAAWLMTAALTTPEARNRTFEAVSPDSVSGSVEDHVTFDWRGPESGLVAIRSDYSIPS